MNGNENLNDGLEIKTDSMDLLRRGFEKTVELANEARKHWEDKISTGGKLYRCNACGKTLKTESAIKKHIEKTDSCKKKNLGYKKVSNVKIEDSDRKLSSEQDLIMEKMKNTLELQ